MGSRRSARTVVGDALRSARAAIGGSAVVLMYHRVARLEHDPLGLAVDPATFDAHMGLLAARYEVLAAAELARRVSARRPLPRHAVVVTFDDGYHDLLHEAKPVLERHGVPATAFVSTAEMDTDRERWWDELTELGGDLAEDERSSLYDRLRAATEGGRDALLDELAGRLGTPRPRRAAYRTLTTGELVDLADGGLIDIGAHTVTHRPLAALAKSEQREELTAGKRTLEAALGREVTLFSYPYGGEDAIGAATPRLVAEAGFSAAFTTRFGLVFPTSDRLMLPRCGVEGFDADTLGARLEHWFSLGR